jgi:hypothetical protein
MQAPLQPAQLELGIGLFRLSRMLHAAARMGIAPLLAPEPRSAPVLAAMAGTHAPTTQAFLDALAAWGILMRDADGRYGLTPVSRRLLPGEADGVNLRQVAGWAGLESVVDAWSGLEHTLRTGESGLRRCGGGDFHARLAEDADANAQYQEAMGATAGAFAACAAALDDLPAELIVDIGGGRGELLAAVLARRPEARGWCVDLPHVVDGLEPQLDGRLRFIAADASRALPEAAAGADLYLTSTVLRCFDDEGALALLGATRRAMNRPGSHLVCFEMLAPDDRADPLFALADMTARVVYGGRDRTAAEFHELLARAGLACEQILPVDGAVHAITAGPGPRPAPA